MKMKKTQRILRTLFFLGFFAAISVLSGFYAIQLLAFNVLSLGSTINQIWFYGSITICAVSLIILIDGFQYIQTPEYKVKLI
jgi:TRAP-type C4-dicarboxylate transport system permease small subunit